MFKPTEEYTVEFQKAPPSTFLDKIKSSIQAVCFLHRRIYNTYLLIRHRELREPASKNVCPMRYLNPFLYLNLSSKIAAKPAIMKAILKHPRKDPKSGFFDDQDNAMVFLPLFRDLYPEETITTEDFMFTCNKENLRKYRQPILEFIGPQNIERQNQELRQIIEDTIQFYCEEKETAEINATEFSFVLAVTVMSKILLGHPGPFSAYREIAFAVDFVNQYLMKKTLKQPLSKEDKEKYQQSLITIRSAIDTSLEFSGKIPHSFVQNLKEEKQLTLLQTKLSLYNMYFAGSDTSAGLTNYLLWQLGRHPEEQERIFQEMSSSKEELFSFATQSVAINQAINESLRLFTPSYVIGRLPAHPLVCIVKDKSGNVVFKDKIGKNEKLLISPSFAGRDPLLFKDPDKFNPQRFNTSMKNYSWFPFGDGAHSCPGQWLAKAEISLFTALLIKKYRFVSFPEQEFKQLGYLTLKSAEKVHLKLFRRN